MTNPNELSGYALDAVVAQINLNYWMAQIKWWEVELKQNYAVVKLNVPVIKALKGK